MEKENERLPIQSLGDRMKSYEKSTAKLDYLDKTIPYVFRCDGHSFSKFTSKLQQPFDMRFVIAMILTTYDTMCMYGANTGYTQSDEITITYFPKYNKDKNEYADLDFNGRIQKLVSLIASYVSVRFNYHLEKLVNEKTYFIELRNIDSETDLQNINFGTAHFDCRCIQFPNVTEVYNHMLCNHHIINYLFRN